MWKISPVLILLVFCTSHGNSAATQKIKVSVYYESLCPDSIYFLTKQFYPTYLVDGDAIIVDFVPFGKAAAYNNGGTWTFVCQHGDAECYGNKIQACAINLYPVKESTEFVICAMGSGDASSDRNLQQCATSTKISWTSIQDCVRSGKADDLLVANGLRTTAVKPAITFIPTITFNDVYSKPLQDLSLTNFRELFEFLLEKKADVILGDDGGIDDPAAGSSRISSLGAFVFGVTFFVLRTIR